MVPVVQGRAFSGALHLDEKINEAPGRRGPQRTADRAGGDLHVHAVCKTDTMTHGDAAVVKMAELFDPEPERWGLRGDPHVWRALRDHLSGTEVPASVDEAVSLLRVAFSELMGVDLVANAESSVYHEEFAHGGMSSGRVSLDAWRDRMLPLLAERAKVLLEP